MLISLHRWNRMCLRLSPSSPKTRSRRTNWFCCPPPRKRASANIIHLSRRRVVILLTFWITSTRVSRRWTYCWRCCLGYRLATTAFRRRRSTIRVDSRWRRWFFSTILKSVRFWVSAPIIWPQRLGLSEKIRIKIKNKILLYDEFQMREIVFLIFLFDFKHFAFRPSETIARSLCANRPCAYPTASPHRWSWLDRAPDSRHSADSYRNAPIRRVKVCHGFDFYSFFKHFLWTVASSV